MKKLRRRKRRFRLIVIGYSPRRISRSADWLSGSDYWESFARRMKTDFPPGRIGRKHQLADGVEDDFELGVIFVFQRRKLAGEFRVGQEHLAQTDKCAHDGDVDSLFPNRSVASPCDQYSLSNGVPARRIDLHGTRTPQDAGEHRDALLGEGVGVAPPNFPRVGITVCDTRFLISAVESSNMKSAGKRSRFLRTACFSARVSTP